MGSADDDQQGEGEVDEIENLIVQVSGRGAMGDGEHMARKCPPAMETRILTGHQGS
jgi:hypothetical protein